MERYRALFLRHRLFLTPVILLLVLFCPLIFWFRLTEYSGRTLSEFWDFIGTRGALIYSALVFTAVIADFVIKYRAFLNELAEFRHGGEATCEIKLPGHKLFLTKDGLISTYGSAVRYGNIDRVLIERSETEALAVYHMYIYRREGKRLIIPVGIRTLPESFDKALSGFNVEVIRQNRPLFSRGGIIKNK